MAVPGTVQNKQRGLTVFFVMSSCNLFICLDMTTVKALSGLLVNEQAQTYDQTERCENEIAMKKKRTHREERRQRHIPTEQDTALCLSLTQMDTAFVDLSLFTAQHERANMFKYRS